ncbi:MAG: ABC transporter ATP-binding protein [Caldilineaceae bacterium]|nr:ABC transporter ATP-binding protein [Caldilineaceae bacterium]
MDGSTVIETTNLTRRFGDVTAVDNLTLAVRGGEIFGVLGHNGAGKTTTVRLLNGVLAPTTGSMRVLGLDPALDGPQLRRRTGVLTETPSLDERLTARENLAYFAAMYDVPQDEIARRVGQMLETFDLSARADDKTGGFSKGMKQRLALARALIHRPELLFLDEPAAGLDPVAARQLHELIQQLSRYEKRTVIICTHNLDEAERLCDRVAVMEQGHLVAVGSPAELRQRLGGALQLVLEVEPAYMSTALSVIGRQPKLRAEQEGAGTLAVLGAQREQIPALVTALVAASVPIYRVALQEPTLQDVYFSLHSNADARGRTATTQPGAQGIVEAQR